jgi:hypothetical protein
MILDERTEFCDAVSLNTGGAGSYLLGDQIDTGAAARDLGASTDNLFLVLQVDTTCTSGGSATGQFHLASDSTAAIATNGTATYHFSTGAIPVATLVAGYVIAIVALPQGALYERFLGILQTTGTAAFTAGKINAFLTTDPSNWRHYADASN